MTIRYASLALALTLAGSMVVPCHADAIPPRMTLNETQVALMGIWQEDSWTNAGWGYGHGTARRTIAIANADMSILTLVGVRPSKDYNTSVIKGAWSAEKIDGTTLKVILSQGEGRGTELTIVFDGPDAFTMTNQETPGYGAARFSRIDKVGD